MKRRAVTQLDPQNIDENSEDKISDLDDDCTPEQIDKRRVVRTKGSLIRQSNCTDAHTFVLNSKLVSEQQELDLLKSENVPSFLITESAKTEENKEEVIPLKSLTLSQLVKQVEEQQEDDLRDGFLKSAIHTPLTTKNPGFKFTPVTASQAYQLKSLLTVICM